MRNSGTFLGTLLVPKEYRCAALRTRAVWRVVISRRWSSRGQAVPERCVHDFLRSKGDADRFSKSPKKAQRLPPPKVQHLPSPAHAGRRATGCAREAVKVNAMLYAFARPERRSSQGKTAAPAGAPREARGSAACGTAALFWVLFWCQKSTAAQLFGFAPYGALSPHADGIGEDKWYPPAVSHFLRSKRHADLLGKRPKKTQCSPVRDVPSLARQRPAHFSPAPSRARRHPLPWRPVFPCDKQQLR